MERELETFQTMKGIIKKAAMESEEDMDNIEELTDEDLDDSEDEDADEEVDEKEEAANW